MYQTPENCNSLLSLWANHISFQAELHVHLPLTFANSAGGTLSPLTNQPSCNFLKASLIFPCFSHSTCLAEKPVTTQQSSTQKKKQHEIYHEQNNPNQKSFKANNKSAPKTR